MPPPAAADPAHTGVESAPAGPLRAAARRSSRHLRAVVRAPFGDVPGPLPRRRTDTSLEEHVTPLQERGMRAFWWDGFWSNASDSLVLNYLGLYLLALGASHSHVGLLASISSLFAALAFIPGARFVERYGRRKQTVLLTTGGLARLSLLAFAAVPLFSSGTTAAWIVIALASFRGFWAFFSVPAWTSLTADVVPVGIRGRFLASRNIGMGIAALAIAPLAGVLIDRFTGLGGWQLVWIIAFVAGAISTWCYARIPEPRHAPSSSDEPAERGIFLDVLSDRNFVVYLASAVVWNISLQAAGPFFNVYLVNNMNASTAMVGLLSAIPALTGLSGAMLFGRCMDARGTKWVLVTSGLLIPLVPLAWIVVSAPWQVIFINALAGVLWAGYHLATTNLVMIMCAPNQRARYAATYQTVSWGAQFLGPLVGGAVIGVAGFHAVFLLSAAGRLGSTLIAMRYVRDDRLRLAAV